MAQRTIPDIATLREICHRGKLEKDRRAWYAASRGVAIYITWLLIHTGVTANQVTLMTVSLAVAGALMLGSPPAWLSLVGACTMLAYHLLDKVDGDVARYRRTYSIVGVYLDEVGHGIAFAGLFLGLGGHLAWGADSVARALLSYLAEASALHSATRTKSQLRRRLVAHVTGSGKVWLAEGGDREDGSPRAGELVTLATRGLDALDEYFSRYLPQLVLACIVPFAVLAVVFWADWISGIVILVTLPLIPVFMALIGMHTQQRTDRQWRLLSRLGGHFLDVVEGLPTLAVFRRAKAQAAIIREVGEDHRSATMGTLRIAFLSAFALELLATLAVALVAVEVGLRLLGGHMDYQTALLVLILAPEAYLPLREVGARFHASMEGVAAADQVFTELDRKRGAAAQRSAEGTGEGGGQDARRAPAPTVGQARSDCASE